MPPSIKRVTFKQYAGFVVRAVPSTAFSAPARPELHMGRAVWLTGQLEAASWGTVQGYDGAAMSGGILHNIAVMPKDLSQGTLFALIRECEVQGGPVQPLYAALAAKGWHVAPDGRLRDSAGGAVSGRAIRNEFTPDEGAVPTSGPKFETAKKWALLFHALLVDPKTYQAQSDYAAKWLAAGNGQAELSVYRRFTNNAALDSMISVPAAALPPAVDLAMSVYHCFSTNAPAPAQKALAKVWATAAAADPTKFSIALIKALGTTSFGKWHDEPGENGPSRYDRCRKAAMRSGLWPAPLCALLMPKDFA